MDQSFIDNYAFESFKSNSYLDTITIESLGGPILDFGSSIDLDIFGKKYEFTPNVDDKLTDILSEEGDADTQERFKSFFKSFLKEYASILQSKKVEILKYVNIDAETVCKNLKDINLGPREDIHFNYFRKLDQFTIGLSMGFDGDEEHGISFTFSDNGKFRVSQGSDAFDGGIR